MRLEKCGRIRRRRKGSSSSSQLAARIDSNVLASFFPHNDLLVVSHGRAAQVILSCLFKGSEARILYTDNTWRTPAAATARTTIEFVFARSQLASLSLSAKRDTTRLRKGGAAGESTHTHAATTGDSPPPPYPHSPAFQGQDRVDRKRCLQNRLSFRARFFGRIEI